MADARTPRSDWLLAYDGSDVAADAIRAAGRLFPGADAHRRPSPRRAGRARRTPRSRASRCPTPSRSRRCASTSAPRRSKRGSWPSAAGRSRRRAGLRASREVRSPGSAWRAVADAADDEAADVIVCGSRGRGPLARAWLGSTSSSLVHHAERPVLVVPPGVGDAGRSGADRLRRLGGRARRHRRRGPAAARPPGARRARVVVRDPAFLHRLGAARRPRPRRARTSRDGHRRDPRRRRPRGRPRTASSSPGRRASRRTAAPSSPALVRGGRWPPSAGRRAPRSS